MFSKLHSPITHFISEKLDQFMSRTVLLSKSHNLILTLMTFMYFPKVPSDGSYTSLEFLIWLPKKRKLLWSCWSVFQTMNIFPTTSWFKIQLGIKVSKIIKFLKVLYKSLCGSRTETEIAGPSIGTVVITQVSDSAVELPAGWPTFLSWLLSTCVALDLLNFVQLVPIFQMGE